ncbi:ORF6N domain-containing protein [Litorisediminicola beolgyonensis]|uniref:ORF6N domain-containing protein n=1 Tax=Litorisediminicola beolgyonensis TaxID=1173614 RepID=A0ABW3ZJ49_9RHOB
MTSPLTLFTIAGKDCPIYTLDGRPPFMLASDLAEVYGTSTKALNQAVKRRQARFPERNVFRLEEAEKVRLRSQSVTANALSSKVRYEPMAFTHAGANMLSGVLKGEIADAVAVAINDAFTTMEQRAMAEARAVIAKLRSDSIVKKPIYGRVQQALLEGQSFDQLFQATNYPRWKLEQAIKEMLGLGLIERAPSGTQLGLFWSA